MEIDLDRFLPDAPREIDPDRPLRLTFVSVYYPHKNPLTFARAAALLRSQGAKIFARITMDRDDFDPWPQYLHEYNAMQQAASRGEIVLGSVDPQVLPALYRETDIFIFPSISETFGFPLVEAMASGVPVIAADTLTNREICGPAALYFPAQDPNVLANRISQLAARRDLYLWLRVEGLKRARTLYSWDAHLDRFIGILESVSGICSRKQ